MKLLYNSKGSIDDLLSAIERQETGDYIYMYPPRQSYQKLDPETAWKTARESISAKSRLNLYFHVPFCNQICSFCNLYTKVSKDENEYSSYVELMTEEIKLFYQDVIRDKEISTLYLGGGTPSLLMPKDIEKLFSFLEADQIVNINTISEVALEVAPDTVERVKFSEYRSIGINRVNLGFQAANLAELNSIGRKHGVPTLIKSLEIIAQIGFSNVCIDLIYGLQGQTLQNWEDSVKFVINHAPETVCIYPLTLRPVTVYNKMGYTNIDGACQYKKYDLARNALLDAGYNQETHVRFVKPRGGYLQKFNHWRLENILGIGAGARSYLWDCDTRNNYSAVKRDKAYKYYVNAIRNKDIPITDGYLMFDEERKRKALILGLINLNREWYKEIFGEDVLFTFPLLYDLEKNNLVVIENEYIKLTNSGLKYRDLIVQLFFSQNVLSRISNYSYLE